MSKNGNGRNGKYTTQQVIAALKRRHGVQTLAAKDLDCTRQTVSNYIKRHPTVRAAWEESRDEFIDLAESKLMEKVSAGEWPAIAFTLKTIGHTRGYVEKRQTELSGKVQTEDVTQMTDDELRTIAKG
jgi:predicted transcriptional regulator